MSSRKMKNRANKAAAQESEHRRKGPGQGQKHHDPARERLNTRCFPPISVHLH